MIRSRKRYHKYIIRPKGSSIITLMAFFMVFVVLSIGLVGFELARYQLLISQLHNILDAATLAGAGALAGASAPPNSIITNPNNNNPPNPNFVPSPNYPAPNSNTSQWNAMEAAYFMFTINQNYNGRSSIQSVLGTPLYKITTVNYDTNQVSLNPPGPNMCNLNIGWVSTQTGKPTTATDPYAKILSASCTYGYQPLFINFFHLPINFNLPTIVQSRAGVSSLDLAICFDLSGSMDDQTPMILVNRYLNPKFQGTNSSNTPTSEPSAPFDVNYNFYNVPNYKGHYAYNTICNLTADYNPTGTSLGLIPGIAYEYGQNAFTGGSVNSVTGAMTPWFWTSTSLFQRSMGRSVSRNAKNQTVNDNRYNIQNAYSSVGTTANYYDSEIAVSAPSNPSSISTPNTVNFTDAVVDIFNTYETQPGNIPTYPSIDFSTGYPGKFIASSTTITLPPQLGGGSYDFPDIPTLVEASRGNLESMATAQEAGLNVSDPNIEPYFQPKAGYYNAYMYAALNLRNPMSIGQTSVQHFMSLLNTSVDIHFAFIPFGDNAHNTHSFGNGGYGNDSVWGHNYFGTYDFSGNANKSDGWINPGIGFSNSTGANASNYKAIYNAIGPVSSTETGTIGGDPSFTQSMTAAGGTNIASALQVAAQEFGHGGHSRIDQGVAPAVILFTDGEPMGGGDNGTSAPNAMAAAAHLGRLGVTLYCVGLAQTPAIQSQQQQILRNLCQANGQAGAQAFFIQPGSAATQKQQLFSAFANIQRGLVGLTQ